MERINKNVDVCLNENGLPDTLTIEDEDGILQEFQIHSVYLQEALCEPINGFFVSNGKIYAYKYKARICPNNNLLTVYLCHYIEEDKWVLET